ncbi:hypothetical protein, partial [Aeromicrobium sp.]|uniref:hypothetical protein n=1 Tax=Aeromicrobium sp. TaxID=1871063 RepID=UPI00199DF994
AGAVAFHFALEVVPGVPVPLTLGIYQPELPPRLSTQVGAVPAAESLAASFRAAEPDAAVSTWGDDNNGVTRVLRMSPADPAAEAARPLLRADYWITAVGSEATTVFSFAAPVLWDQTAPALLELLDAIISTVQWSPGDPQDADAVAAAD